MTSNPQQGPPGSAGILAPVEPVLFVKLVVRPLTKILNPLIVRLAGRRHFRMAAQIRHVGRRSGRSYVTPAGARLHGEVIMIPPTGTGQLPPARHPPVHGPARGARLELTACRRTRQNPSNKVDVFS
jgi:hypothetical protein